MTIWVGDKDPGDAAKEGDIWIDMNGNTTIVKDKTLNATLLQARVKWEAEGLPESVIRLAVENLRVLIRSGECPMMDGTMYDQGRPKRPPVQDDDFDYRRR